MGGAAKNESARWCRGVALSGWRMAPIGSVELAVLDMCGRWPSSPEVSDLAGVVAAEPLDGVGDRDAAKGREAVTGHR
jgi:hypothetical protein